MSVVIIVAFLLGLAAVITAMVKVIRGSIPRAIGLIYWLLVVVAAGVCVFTTFNYNGYSNSNTRFYGWPIPIVIFQRQDAESPWLDFVGLTTFLAYPINLILFLIVPSVALLAWSRFKRSSDNKDAEKARSSHGG
jgi:membrane protein implicated in regulation of membrane protease activity